MYLCVTDKAVPQRAANDWPRIKTANPEILESQTLCLAKQLRFNSEQQITIIKRNFDPPAENPQSDILVELCSCCVTLDP